MTGAAVKRGTTMANVKKAIGVMVALSIGVPALAGPAAQPVAKVRAPEVIFAKVCGYCHSTRVGPVLLGRNLPPEYIEMTARSGRNAMPSFRQSEISNAELAGLARWIAHSRPPVDGGSH